LKKFADLTIDIDLKKIKFVIFDFDGVFTDNYVYVNDSGQESVRCWRSDGIGIERVRNLGIELMIISTEVSEVVLHRAKKLKLRCIGAASNKELLVREECSKLGIPLEQVLYLGNDINDIPALKIVGVAVGVGDAYEEINPYILFRTKKYGGRGAVREVCDLIFNANNGNYKSD